MDLVWITIGAIVVGLIIGVLIKLPEWVDEMFKEDNPLDFDNK